MPAANKQLLFSISLVLALAFPALSQTVLLLKNGDRISGRVLEENDRQIILAAPWGAQVTVPCNQVSARQNDASDALAAAPLAGQTNTPTLTNSPAPTRASGLSLTSAPGSCASSNSLAQTNKTLSLDVQLGASVHYNQVSSDSYSGLLKSAFTGEQNRAFAECLGAYGRAGTNISANRVAGTLRGERDLPNFRRAFLFDAASMSYDEVRKIDMAYDDGLGVGYKFVSRKNFSFSAEMGSDYQEEYFTGGAHPCYFSMRVAETMRWNLLPRLSLDQKTEYYPHWGDFGSFRLCAEGALNYKLNDSGSIYLTASLTDTYDTNPAHGVLPNDLLIASRIGLKF